MTGARTRRDESWSDALLRLAPYAPIGLRVAMARRAAARGMGDPALTAAGDDAMVLSRLGMSARAAATTGGGRSGAIARAIASASLGDIDLARRFLESRSGLSNIERRALAAGAAPFDPSLALRLLPKADRLDRAACALAAGDLAAADRYLEATDRNIRAGYIRGAVAAWRGDWRSARAALNQAFLADGLAAPLSMDSDAPTVLESFANLAILPAIDGPLVSVVVAAHDAEGSLELAVRSLTAQTWRNIEIVVVDDRSNDGTRALASRLAARDPRVRSMANQRGPGAYGARNTGIAVARGEFIALHDADDWAHPQRIERQMKAIGIEKGLTICRYFRLDSEGRPMCPRVFPFVRFSPIAMLARAETWVATGPFEEVAVGADSEWLARFDGRWGRRAGRRTQEVGMVAAWGQRSLSGAPETGLTGQGLRRRIAYVESWRLRQAGLPAPHGPAADFARARDTG